MVCRLVCLLKVYIFSILFFLLFRSAQGTVLIAAAGPVVGTSVHRSHAIISINEWRKLIFHRALFIDRRYSIVWQGFSTSKVVTQK